MKKNLILIVSLSTIVIACNNNVKTEEVSKKADSLQSILDNQKTIAEAEQKEADEMKQKEDYQLAHQAELIAQKNALINSISVDNSTYSVGALGGVMPFDVYVINNGDYEINNTIVEVKYFKNNGKIAETQKLIFGNIKPKEKKTITTDQTVNGRQVEIIIMEYTCSDLNVCYYYDENLILSASRGTLSDDAYFCE